MKVLVITRNAWDDTNSIGNTMSNFFANADDIEFANIYFRASKPNNRICKKYFHVTEKEILCNWFHPEKIGSAFYCVAENEEERSYSSENKLISMIHKYNLSAMYAISERLWDEKKWINEKFRKFISDFAPDVAFSFVKAAPQYYHTIKYLREECHIRTVLWIADDEYSVYAEKKDKKSADNIDRIQYIIGSASSVYGCSQEICDLYSSVFGCTAKPLYKSCSFEYLPKKTVSNPIRIVYAGNLLFGRLEILKKLVSELVAHPAMAIEIYSNTPISNDDQAAFDIDGHSKFCGVKPYSEIKIIMAEADIVLHVESFEKNEILKTKYSFSTKIIDCLQSGSVMLAVGPAELSSIKYISKIQGAIVVDDLNKIGETFRSIVQNTNILPEKAASIREFAIKNHSSINCRSFLFNR